VTRCTKHKSKGVSHYCAKLTEADVREIRLRSESLRLMAAKYGVTKSTISGIVQGRTWRHVI
jgi:hypothetical protein